MESGQTAATERLNVVYHAIIGMAMGLISPFTGLAWPVAIVVGSIIGLANVERTKGIEQRAAVHMLRALAVVGGIIAMLVLGAILGGLIALLIVGLAAFSERVSGNTGPTDRGMARILIAVMTTVIWIALVVVLKLNLSIKIGG